MDKKQLNDSLASIKNSSADRIILPGNSQFWTTTGPVMGLARHLYPENKREF